MFFIGEYQCINPACEVVDGCASKLSFSKLSVLGVGGAESVFGFMCASIADVCAFVDESRIV